MYDKAHKTATPTWKVNDKVWLYDNTVKWGSPRVVTRQRYTGPYVIKVVQTLVQLISCLMKKTGKTLKNLATHDRLKLCNLERKKFSERLPRLATGEGEQPQSKPEVALDNLGGQQVEAQPLKIMADKRIKGKTQYLVRFDDGADYWCDWVSLLLKQNYEKTRSRKSQLKSSRK